MMVSVQYDALQRFLFEDTPIRGNVVHLHGTLQRALEHQHCPPVLREALGQLIAASVLLSSTLKMNGSLILQIQGSGALKLLVVECTADHTVRATAKWSDDLPEDSILALLGEGQFVIMLDPKDGGQIYQGIVPLEGDSISDILQNYMQRSEQIETRIWLACDGDKAAGMLLQKLPDQPEQDADAWARTGHLAETVKTEELLNLPVETLLRRLFHEETVRLFEPQAVRFHCSCSRKSVGAMLRMLGQEEISGIIEEMGSIEVRCDFCNKRYEFDRIDAEQLFTPDLAPGSDSKH